MPSLAASASASSFPLNSLIAAASATAPSTSPGRPSSRLSSSSNSTSTSKPNTVALGRTRCYWSILSPSLDYIAVDPILHAHLKEQKDSFLGTNMLDYVHPDERDALRADLMPNPGRDGQSGIEQAGIFGSVTRCRYSRVPRIRKMLGATEPETDPEAKLIAYDSEYISIDITTSWIGGGETGLGSGNGDELRGAVLAFFHATTDKDEARDNDESHRSHWSNWCGPRVEDGGYLDQARCAELEAALARATSYNISRRQSLSEGPPPHVFQILNTEGHPIVTFPPPSTPAHEYNPAEYAALGQQVVNKPRPSHESRTSCTRRYRDKHPLLKAGSLVSIESVVILYGAITFCVFDTGGIYLSAAAKQRAVSSTSPVSSSRSSTSSPRVSNAAKKFELEDVPFSKPGQPKAFSFDYPNYPPYKRSRIEAPLGPTTPHDPIRLEVPQASSERLSPPGNRRNGGLSPTVASSAAILGSLTGGPHPNPSTSPVHHTSPHLPPVQDLYRPMQPQSAPYPAPPQPHYPFSHPSTFGHPLYHQQPHMSTQMYPMYPQHSLTPQQHPMMHMAAPHGYPGYPSPSLPPLGNPYGTAGGSLLSHQPHHMMQHPHLMGHSSSSHFNGDGSLPPPRTGLSEEGSSTHSNQHASNMGPSDLDGLNRGSGDFSASDEGGSSWLNASTSKKEKAAKTKNDPAANKPGPAACESCGTANSPEWRKGPSGNKSLCNACGLRYARQVSRAAKIAAAAASGEPLLKKGKKSKKVKAAEAALAEANAAAASGSGALVSGLNGNGDDASHGPETSLDEDSFFHAHPGAHHQDGSSSPQLGNAGDYHLPSMQPNGGAGPNGFDHHPHQQQQQQQHQQHHQQQQQQHHAHHHAHSHSHHDFFGNGHGSFEADQGANHGERSSAGAGGGGGGGGVGEGQQQQQAPNESNYRAYGF
ncbi:BQ2448_7474 [Microbotryum intermedium]|uniref:BQ2448_7474 protein n=1 Tax=Microbotryum intermedium TaxID=269621 RepID=A0A238FQS4_9BASI|nr:BQ2448_7474 [Microbotryum intermedium]